MSNDLKNFSINVQEIYSRTVIVQATNEIAAIRQVERMVERGDIILDDQDWFGRNIKNVDTGMVEKYLINDIQNEET